MPHTSASQKHVVHVRVDISTSARPPIIPSALHLHLPPANGTTLVVYKIIGAIMSSAQEAETGAALINTHEAIALCTTLEELGHEQGPTPIQIGNKCAVGIINETMTHQRRPKPMDVRFY